MTKNVWQCAVCKLRFETLDEISAHEPENCLHHWTYLAERFDAAIPGPNAQNLGIRETPSGSVRIVLVSEALIEQYAGQKYMAQIEGANTGQWITVGGFVFPASAASWLLSQ